MRRLSFSLAALLFVFPTFASADPVNIILTYDSTVSVARQAVFEQAATVWEGVLNEYTATGASGDVTISATLPVIDGAGGILGAAGPQQLFQTGGFLYTRTGQMLFDIADVANLETQGTFDDVILHEMAHVMGFGTLWNGPALGAAGTQNIYNDGSGEYTGANALGLWQREFGQSGAPFVPIEQGGGSGTRDSHWDEVDGGAGATGVTVQFGPDAGRDLRDELMTGWLNPPNPYISNMTKASFADIGYNSIFSVPEPSAAVVLAGLSLLACKRRRRA